MPTSTERRSMMHALWMILGCLLPLLLIFLLPVFGVSPGVTTVVFFVLMLGCHLMMLGGHGGHGEAERHQGSDREPEERAGHRH